MKNKFKGFTLVELLLVVTILGILAAIAMPKLFPQTEKARVAEAIAILQSIRQGEAADFLEKETYCDPNAVSGGCEGSWNGLGMDNPNPGRYFTYSVTLVAAVAGLPAGFDATATRRTDVSDPGGTYGGKKITIDETGTYAGDHPFRPT